MPTIKLVLEYDGTRYAGWQRQPDQPTIQEAVERAIQQVGQITASVIGAGRTDAGVHARGQVASFRTTRDWSAADWMRALNAVLPEDIAVQSTALMPDAFHARHDARGKLYRYSILNRSAKPTVDRAFVWHVHTPLNEAAMQQAALLLVGRHDFSSFEGSLTDNTDPICNLQRLTVIRRHERIEIDAYADRFLKHMVRAIVGTVVEVGRGKRPPEHLLTILTAHDRRAAGQTAPSHGLSLMQVDYNPPTPSSPRDSP